MAVERDKDTIFLGGGVNHFYILNMDLKFIAEVREVKSRKLITNDVEFTIKLNTDDPAVLQLGTLPADQLLSVTIVPNNVRR